MSQQHSFITLEQLSLALNQCINQSFGARYFWIVAEISGYNVRKGNCYMNLIDKDPQSVYPKAEFRGIIWRSGFQAIHHKFAQETQQELKENMKILFRAKLHYDNKFGIALHIEDIEPGYTLGQMALDRQLVIKKLKQEGVYDLNKKKIFPEVPQKLAIISNVDSKGFEDFQDKIDNNPWGYKFSYQLYPSLLQGEKAAANIRKNLIQIFHDMQQNKKSYDVVLILRGGGGNTNLNCFNNYDLARAVARFPIPVITGIGHTTNISVVDEIAFAKKNTPTDVADFILRQTREFDIELSKILQSIVSLSKRRIPLEKENLENSKNNLELRCENLFRKEKNLLNVNKLAIINQGKHILQKEKSEQEWFIKSIQKNYKNIITKEGELIQLVYKAIKPSLKRNLQQENLLLKLVEDKIRLLDPKQILKRGFSITYHNGKSVQSVSSLKEGDTIESSFIDGSVKSIIKKN